MKKRSERAHRSAQSAPFKGVEKVVCWEALATDDRSLAQARKLYEATLDPAERIPWRWIERSIEHRQNWRPGDWGRHLLLAAPQLHPGDFGPVVGYTYGVHLAGYG